TYSELQRRKAKWVLVQAFRAGVVSTSSQTFEQSGADHAQKSDGRDEKGPTGPANSSLRASTAAFRPTAGRPSEVEDGEVDEARASNAAAKTNGPNLPRSLPAREPLREPNPPAPRTGVAANSGRPVTPKPPPAPHSN